MVVLRLAFTYVTRRCGPSLQAGPPRSAPWSRTPGNGRDVRLLQGCGPSSFGGSPPEDPRSGGLDRTPGSGRDAGLLRGGGPSSLGDSPAPPLERERQVADVKTGSPPLPGARGRPANILPDGSRDAAGEVGKGGWVENLVGALGGGGVGALDTLRLYIYLSLLSRAIEVS